MAKELLLDLHGYKIEDVADAVDRFLVQAGRKGVSRAKIMTGKGTGQVRKKVIEYLKLGGFPHEFEKMPNGQRNEGVLIVFVGD